MLLVLGAIGVEQINRYPPYVRAPGLEGNLIHPDFNATDHRLPLLVQHGLDWEVLGIQQRVILGLPIVSIDGLLKIAFPIEQADPDKTKAKVARRFGMIAR